MIKCYACDTKACGTVDRTDYGEGLQVACQRHAEPGSHDPHNCWVCGGRTSPRSIFDHELASAAHKKCLTEQCR